MKAGDESGTPVALLELARRSGRLLVQDRIDADEILVEFPFCSGVAEPTGCSRFVRLRTLEYALVR